MAPRYWALCILPVSGFVSNMPLPFLPGGYVCVCECGYVGMSCVCECECVGTCVCLCVWVYMDCHCIAYMTMMSYWPQNHSQKNNNYNNSQLLSMITIHGFVPSHIFFADQIITRNWFRSLILRRLKLKFSDFHFSLTSCSYTQVCIIDLGMPQ